ncbi:MAG TPA: type I methionyl aminopeptidase [Edaphobacter sp.]|jgi:methionyl aminopeptidase|nr:type I methionyl aminopeptidase [Edaphobacter sp.]
MSIESVEDLAGMELAGKVTRAVLNAMKEAVHPGITTGELDEIGAAVMHKAGGRSAPRLVYNFPGRSCISVNDEIVHGVPGKRRLVAGDIVKLDVTVEVNGYMADASESIGVGSLKRDSRRLVDCATLAFHNGLAQVRPGARAYDIGRAVHRTVAQAGYSVVNDLMGHGIGRTIHEQPSIPNHFDPRCADILTEGLVFTIEPLISMGDSRTVTLKDGWTVRTRDRSLAAHHEHTVVVTADGARLLTA